MHEIGSKLQRNISVEHDMKVKLCTEGMEAITNTYEIISEFKYSSELGENAEIDHLLESFLKSMCLYLKECCLNPYLRYKAEMKEYLKGMTIISLMYNEVKS